MLLRVQVVCCAGALDLRHSDFLGRWRAARQITDHAAGQNARFEGTAVLTQEAEHWRYAETGILQVTGAAPMQAERVYLWIPVAEGFDILFEDGRFFHHMALQSEGRAAHWCDPDQYDLRYLMDNWPNWTMIWRVTGPRKNYEMRTVYCPV